MVKQSTRDVQALIDEAATISHRFRESGKAPREPNAVSRLLALLDESGLGVVEFCRRAKINASSVYMWKSGKTTSGKEWPALVAANTKRTGAALAAAMNAEIGGNVVSFAKVMANPSGPASRVTAVTRWRDAYGDEHTTPDAAEAATLRGDVTLASHNLWSSVSDVSDLPKVSDLVLALADAIRAEREWKAHHATASA